MRVSFYLIVGLVLKADFCVCFTETFLKWTVPNLNSSKECFNPKLMLVYFQFSPVLSLLRDTPSHISSLLSFNNSCSLKVLPLLHMDQPTRIKMPPPIASNSPASTNQDNQTRAPATAAPEPPVSSLPVENPHDRVRQLGHVQSQLQSGASLTLVTGMAKLTTQM